MAAPESGKGTSGRWTVLEHDMFVEGLRRFGRCWRSISQLVPTRSVVQIRTHAQKFFMKLEKVSSGRRRAPWSRNAASTAECPPRCSRSHRARRESRSPRLAAPPGLLRALAAPLCRLDKKFQQWTTVPGAKPPSMLR